MKLSWTTIYVADLARSLRFYHELLKLPIASRMDTAERTIVMLGREEDAKVELIFEPEREIRPGESISMGFRTENLADATKAMELSGHDLVQGPLSPAPGVSFSFFKDPDGYQIQLFEQHES